MDESTLRWRKSSFSAGNNGDCVEVAHTLAAVRDSKNAHGPVLAVDLAPLLIAVKGGRINR